MQPAQTTRVLLVEPDAALRAAARRHWADGTVCELFEAADAVEARRQIILVRPDVILCELDLPRISGLQLIRRLREYYPVPVIACADRRSADALQALQLGALDLVLKPAVANPVALRQYFDSLSHRIPMAVRQARPVRFDTPRAVAQSAAPPAGFGAAGLSAARFVVVVGASTGGTEAIRVLLDHAPADFPPVVIVQHMPVGFTRSFAERLDRSSPLRVSEAVDGEPLLPGTALVARGDTQLTIAKAQQGWLARYTHQQLVNRHCPAVDVLFEAAAEQAAAQSVGVLLTGMGSDGAAGLRLIREAGGLTLAQDKDSCVVYGMPKAAVERGAAQLQGRPDEMPRLILAGMQGRQRQLVEGRA